METPCSNCTGRGTGPLNSEAPAAHVTFDNGGWSCTACETTGVAGGIAP